MAKSYKEINQDQRQFGSAYRKASPDTMNAFWLCTRRRWLKALSVLSIKS